MFLCSLIATLLGCNVGFGHLEREDGEGDGPGDPPISLQDGGMSMDSGGPPPPPPADSGTAPDTTPPEDTNPPPPEDTGPGPEADGHIPSCPPSNPAEACEVFRIVNQERMNNGLPPFAYDGQLALSAQRHAIDMHDLGYFSHSSQDGRSFSDRTRMTAYSAFPSGENIAQGQRSPSSVMTAWMNSPGHRANILHNRHNEIGVGFYNYYWVQVMGTR